MDYIVDVDNRRLVGDFLSTRSASPGSAVFGDTPDISVRFVESNPTSNAQPWRYIDMAGKSARVAIGQPGALPESGNFTLTFGGDETSNIDFASANLATAIDSALNALASVTAAGGVTVSEILGGKAFQVDFDAVGAQALITAGTDRLSPSSSAVVTETTAGDGTTAESQVIAFERDPGAYIELTTDIAAPTATVTTLQTGILDTLSEVQRIAFTGDPWIGTYTINIDGNVTSLLTPTSTIDEIQTEINTTLGTGNTLVTGVPLDYTIQFSQGLGNVGTVVVDVTALVGATGKTGSLDLNTNEFYELLDGASTATATLEIVLYDTNNSTSDTIIQQAITCRQDVIPDTPPSQTPVPTYAAQSHTHLEADISNLGTAITLNADDNLTGNAWFFDDDTLGGVDADAEKCASQASIKNYVDNEIAGLGSLMEFKGSYDANTTDPTDGDVGDTYVVTVAGTGVASFWSTALEIGDVIIQENATATTEADWVVVSRDIVPASETVAGVVELATQAEVNTGTDTTKAVTPDTLSNYSGFPVGGLLNIVEDTTPELGGDLEVSTSRTFNDQSGNELLGFENPGVSAVNYLAIKNASTSTGPVLKAVGDDTDVDISLQAKGAGAVNITGAGGLDLKSNKIQTLGKDTITLIGNGSDSHVSIMCHTSTNNPSIGVVSTNTNQGLTLNAKGTGNIKLGNLEFDADQSIGAGNDNHVLTYDNATGSVSLEAAQGLFNIVEDTAPQLGGMLDVNGNAIGDGTRELLAFVEAGSAVNHLEISNANASIAPQIEAVGDDTDIDLLLVAKGTGVVQSNSPVRVNGVLLGNHSTRTGDGTTTINWNGFGGMVKFTFGAFNETFTFTEPTELNCSAILHMSLTQDGVGSRTVTWPASVKWPGGTAPTLSTGAGAIDLIKFVWDGTNYYGTYDLNFS